MAGLLTPADDTTGLESKVAVMRQNLDSNERLAAAYRDHADEGRLAMQKDISELKDGHLRLHARVDEGFARIEAMIIEDRLKDREVSGALKLARWFGGVLVSLSSAATAWWVYWFSRAHH